MEPTADQPISATDPGTDPSTVAAGKRLGWAGVKDRVDALWGFDAFIAHRQVDGQDYAQKLYDLLTTDGIACFIDTEVYNPGDGLKVATKRNVSKSTVLVVVGSPQVYRKPTVTQGRESTDWVNEEVDTYLAAKETDAKVIFLNFDNAFERSPNHPTARALEDVLRLQLDAEELQARPSHEVVRAVKDQLDGQRRDATRLRIFRGISVALAGLLLVVGLLSLVARSEAETANQEAVNAVDRQVEGGIQTRRAEQNGALAQANEELAVANEAEAIRQTDLAEQNLEQALENLKEAARQGMDVKRNRRDSQRNAAEALRQQGIAEDNLTLALINEQIAKENEALAQQNLATAASRELAALAVIEADERPWLALLLAVDSWFASPLGLEPEGAASVSFDSSDPERRTLESRSALATALLKFAEAPIRADRLLATGLDDLLGATTLSRDGEVVAYPADDGSVHIQRFDTGQSVGQPIPFEGRVQSLAFDLEGTSLAVIAFDGTLTLDLWDIEAGTVERIATRDAVQGCINPLDPVCLFLTNSKVEFAPNGTQLVALMHDRLRPAEILIWDLSDIASGPTPLDLSANGVASPSDFDLSPLSNDAYTIGVVSPYEVDGPIGGWSLWEGNSFGYVRSQEDSGISGIEFDPAGSGSFVTSFFNQIARRDTEGTVVGQNRIPVDFSTGPLISHLGVSLDGQTLTATIGSDDAATTVARSVVWFAGSDQPSAPVPADGSLVATLFHPDDYLLSIGTDGSLTSWDISDPTPHGAPTLRSFVDDPILDSVAVGSNNVAYSTGRPNEASRAILVRNMSTGVGQQLRGSTNMSGLVIARDDSALVARSPLGLFHWDLSNGLDAEAQLLPFERAIFSSDLRSALEITPSGVTRRTWPEWRSTETLPLSSIQDLTSRGLLDFVPIDADDELRRLVAPDGYGMVQIIDLATGHATVEFQVPLNTLIQPTAARTSELWWAPGGRHVAARGDLGFYIRDAHSGDLIRRLPPEIIELTFGPDGSYYATAGPQGVQLWDMATGEALGSSWGGDSFSRVDIGADGQSLLFGHAVAFGGALPHLEVLPGIAPTEACRLGLPGGEAAFRELRGHPSICSEFFD